MMPHAPSQSIGQKKIAGRKLHVVEPAASAAHDSHHPKCLETLMAYLYCEEDGVNRQDSIHSDYAARPEEYANEFTLFTCGILKGSWCCDQCNASLDTGDTAYLVEYFNLRVLPTSRGARDYFIAGTTDNVLLGDESLVPSYRLSGWLPRKNQMDLDVMQALEVFDLRLRENSEEKADRKSVISKLKTLIEAYPFCVAAHIRASIGVFSWIGILNGSEPDIRDFWRSVRLPPPFENDFLHLLKTAVLSDAELADKLNDYVLIAESGESDPLAQLYGEYPSTDAKCGIKFVAPILRAFDALTN
jgi:hypothetical protein